MKWKNFYGWIIVYYILIISVYVSLYVETKFHLLKIDRYVQVLSDVEFTMNMAGHGNFNSNVEHQNDMNVTHIYYTELKNSEDRILHSNVEDSDVQASTLDRTISKCTGLKFPLHLAREDTWFPVDRNRQSFIFSAYFVETERQVVIVGAKSGEVSAFFCQNWFQIMIKENVSFRMVESPAVYTSLPGSHGHRYSAALFECSLNSSLIPTYVSIVTNSCHIPRNLLPVQPAIKQEPYERRFTVCLSPLHFQYARDYELVEWIELNRILGAEKFIVYNYSSAINVTRVLDFYSKRGLTEVVQWRLPMRVNTHPNEHEPIEIHYFGQIASLNDCLYRNKQHSEFIVNLDLDEFIIPHFDNVTSWAGMIQQLSNRSRSYLFRNIFFKKEWDNGNIQIPNKTIVDKLRLVTLRKMQHERNIYLPRQRSKYITRTSDVSQVMTHVVLGNKMENVAIDVGLLHHYRNRKTTNDPERDRIVDMTVSNKFGQVLINNVLNILSNIKINK